MGNPTSMALLEESMNLVSECAPYLASIKEISGADLSDLMFNQIIDMGAEFDVANVEKVEKNG